MTANKRVPADRRPTGAAFLLAQLGAHGARRFAERVAEIGLTAPDAGLLRKIASDPGVSQQARNNAFGLTRWNQLSSPARARNILSAKECSQKEYASPYELAVYYALMEDRDRTFEWLEKAYTERSGRLEYVKVEEFFEPFHSDPRYIDLLKRMGLPQ